MGSKNRLQQQAGGGGGGGCALPTDYNSPLVLPLTPNQRALLAVPRLLRQASFNKKDEESGGYEPYELVDRVDRRSD